MGLLSESPASTALPLDRRVRPGLFGFFYGAILAEIFLLLLKLKPEKDTTESVGFFLMSRLPNFARANETLFVSGGMLKTKIASKIKRRSQIAAVQRHSFRISPLLSFQGCVPASSVYNESIATAQFTRKSRVQSLSANPTTHRSDQERQVSDFIKLNQILVFMV